MYSVLRVPASGHTLAHDALRVLIEQNALPAGVSTATTPGHSDVDADGEPRPVLLIQHGGRASTVSCPAAALRFVMRLRGLHAPALDAWDSLLGGAALPPALHSDPVAAEAVRRSSLRVTQLALLARLQSAASPSPWNYTAATARVLAALNAHFVPFRAARVPANYYSLPLSERAQLLNASTTQLCKTLIVDNQRVSPPQYLALIVPYASDGFASKRLNQWWRAADKKSKALVNWRLSAAGEELSGFARNAVCPLGMRVPMACVVDTRIDAMATHVWLGGGEEDVKLYLAVSDLVRATHAARLDLTGADEKE